MKRAHRELRQYIKELPPEEYRACLASMHRPIVQLQEDALFFRGPFAHLRLDPVGFDPLLQFVLARAEAGDPLAVNVRLEQVRRERAMQLHELRQEPETDYWTQFFTDNQAAWDALHRTAAPWLFSTPPNSLDRFQRDPAIDLELNTAVLTNLGTFGFRRLARHFQSDTLGEPLLIRWDKGTWSINLSLYLEMPQRCFFANLGVSFSSGSSFDFTVAARAGPRLQHFFRVLATVFPALLQAIRAGTIEQDRWLERRMNGAA